MIKNIVVIGGGPAGIEASRQLRNLGYLPILIEKEPQLGGHLAKWDRLFPYGEKAADVVKKLTRDLDGIKYFTSTEVISCNKLKDSYVIKFSNGLSVQAPAVLLTTGFKLFPAEKKQEYGYGIYNKVITNADVENYFKNGSDSRIDNPKSIGFVHCVGSRDEKAGNRQCSKVCCATAIKQACELKEKFPDATVYSFYMDLRLFGRNYEDMYLNAQKTYGIRFVRGRVSEVSEDIDGKVIIKAEDTLFGKPMKIRLDLLVLMAGMVTTDDRPNIAKMMGLSLGEDGFHSPDDPMFNPCLSQKGGIFLAGTATGPKTLPETLNEARAAAISIDNYIKKLEK